MAVGGDRENTDPDDWFDEPQVSDTWSAESEAAPSVEDWTADAADTGAIDRAPRRMPGWPVIAAVGLALAALFGVLAAAGVFSGGHHATAPPAPTTRPAPTTQTSPTSTQPQTPVIPTAPLKPGDSGPEVRKLQHALALAGVSPGAIDGSYGSATTQAVTRFQQAHGLVADGIAGAKTLAALKTALQTG